MSKETNFAMNRRQRKRQRERNRGRDGVEIIQPRGMSGPGSKKTRRHKNNT